MNDEKHAKSKIEGWLMHYTGGTAFKAIRSQKEWAFKASQPPGENPIGAYFTTLTPDAYHFSARLRIPKEKQEFVFAFIGQEGLRPKIGGKGDYIFWAPEDYIIRRDRQKYNGKAEALP